jgi:hypothetical protein
MGQAVILPEKRAILGIFCELEMSIPGLKRPADPQSSYLVVKP